MTPKLLMYGFSNPVTDAVVPSLRKKGFQVTWFGLDEPGYNAAPDRFVGKFSKFSKTPLPMPNGFGEIHAKCFESIIYFLNICIRPYGRYFEKNLFDMIDEFNIYFNFYAQELSKNKVDAILFSYAPHDADAYVLYLLAKQLGIPTIIFYPGTYFPNKTNYLFDLNDLGDVTLVPKLSKTPVPPLKPGVNQKLERVDYAVNPYIVKQPNKNSVALKRWLKRHPLIWSYGSTLLHGKWTMEEFANAYTSFKRKTTFIRDEKRAMVSTLDLEAPYVYFPLHLQPELVTALYAGRYFDQISAIEQLAHFIPKHWKIVVKEHPYYQSEYQRGEGFYKRLLAIPNVIFIHKNTSSHSLIEHSEFVASITGAAGYEAVCAGKKSLYFGKSVFKSLAGSFTYSDTLTFDDFMKSTFTFDELKETYQPFSQALGDGIFDTFLAAEYGEFNKEKNTENIEYLILELLKYKSLL